MRILLTGASSFTGFWFAKAMVEAGHEVRATFSRANAGAYDDTIRGQRVALLQQLITPIFGCRFGEEKFLSEICDASPELLCHHGADVTNYKSADFDYQAAFAANTHRIRDVLQALSDAECTRIVLTGSVFEAGEGAGSDGLPNFSPYGLSKSLTSATFTYFCQQARLSLGKFVIANPFGPWEEHRFTAYLIRCWHAKEVAVVRTPDYVRDNIHVSLLASAYEAFVSQLPIQPGLTKLNPSLYAETQREFAERFAREIGSRLRWVSELEFSQQSDFSEPLVRVSTDRVDVEALGWSEMQAWDGLAEYYSRSA